MIMNDHSRTITNEMNLHEGSWILFTNKNVGKLWMTEIVISCKKFTLNSWRWFFWFCQLLFYRGCGCSWNKLWFQIPARRYNDRLSKSSWRGTSLGKTRGKGRIQRISRTNLLRERLERLACTCKSFRTPVDSSS